jgi:hypothetical protein
MSGLSINSLLRARVSDNGMAPDRASEVVAVKHLLKSRHE